MRVSIEWKYARDIANLIAWLEYIEIKKGYTDGY